MVQCADSEMETFRSFLFMTIGLLAKPAIYCFIENLQSGFSMTVSKVSAENDRKGQENVYWRRSRDSIARYLKRLLKD